MDWEHWVQGRMRVQSITGQYTPTHLGLFRSFVVTTPPTYSFLEGKTVGNPNEYGENMRNIHTDINISSSGNPGLWLHLQPLMRTSSSAPVIFKHVPVASLLVFFFPPEFPNVKKKHKHLSTKLIYIH